jgi:predicted DNA-binding transcriptional regulator YafY
LVLKAGVWYLVARAGGQARTYRVSSILTLAPTEETFVRPEKFDLPAYWTTWTEDFEARLYRGQARLKLSAEGLRRLPLLGAAVAEMAARTAEGPDETGWTRVDIPIESIGHAVGEVLRLGAEAEVLDPPELRGRLADVIAQLGATYPDKRAAQP